MPRGSGEDSSSRVTVGAGSFGRDGDEAPPAAPEEQLREGEAQYQSIFEATNDGLVIRDLETGRIVEANPAFCRMHGYTYDEMLNLPQNAHVHPDYHNVFAEYMRVHQSSDTFHTQAFDVRKDGTVFPVEVRGATFLYRGKPHVLGVVRDMTERMEAEERLREREEQYRSIFESTSDALVIVDTDQIVVEVNPAACAMYGYSRDEFVGLPVQAIVHPDYHDPEPVQARIIDSGGTVRIQEVALRKDGTTFHVEVRGAPFSYKGRPHRLAVVRDITERVQAFELLEQRVQERTRELSALIGVSQTVSSTLQLQPLLDLILEQLKVVAEYVGAALLVVQEGDLAVLVRRAPGPDPTAGPDRYPLEGTPLWEILRQGRPIIVDDVRGDTALAHAYRAVVGEHLEESFAYERSWLAVPMSSKDQVIGVITLSSNESGYFTTHHADLALAIAQQAAIAIENARLFEKAQQVAALEERQRLARELHDSVSQALFGIRLGARTARIVIERDPEQAIPSLDYVLSLAQAGMAEMRALIFELRPESLETEGLVAALRKQSEAASARYEIAVHAVLCDEPEAPLPVKEAIYRIVQEALQNTIKHAHASRIDLSLTCSEEQIAVQISDDGSGFDTSASFPGHLGLHSMKERAARLGGRLEVESAAGTGTRIRARIPYVN